MPDINFIISEAECFYRVFKDDDNGRYRSWEYCYKCFIEARNKNDIDYDYLSLMLAFYLASWGMYRGSSFLLQKDYKVHIPVVKELLDKKYNALSGIKCADFKNEDNQALLKEINKFLSDYYNKIRVKEIKRNEVSSTLITKILMGTLGCVPAYDRYFISGVKNKKVTTGTYNINNTTSIMRLVEFYEQNNDALENARNRMKIDNTIEYPQMKLLDMAFWKIGFDLNN